MLKERLLTAAITIPILLAIVFWSGPIGLLLLLLLVNGIALHELWALFPGERAQGAADRTGYLPTLVSTSALLVAFHTGQHVGEAMIAVLLVALATAVVSAGDLKVRSRAIFLSTTGAFYVTVLLGHLVLIRGLQSGPLWIFLLLGIVMLSDTGAYFAGRRFGKHPLAPQVSPKKTWEGSIGGLASAGLFAVIVMGFVDAIEVRWYQALLLGLVTAAVSQLGDLAESLLKRGVDVKDSGSIFPGHGGILDRLDSILPGCAVLYYGLTMLGIGPSF